MQCTKRLQLEKKYQLYSAAFAAARGVLDKRMAVCPREEFLRLNAKVDKAQAAVDWALRALDSHIKQHCCLTHGGEVPV